MDAPRTPCGGARRPWGSRKVAKPRFLENRRALLVAVIVLAGCGFELRHTPEMPFGTIALTGFDVRSPLADELKRTLATRVKVVQTPDKADVVLQALLDQRERSVVASTPSAQVRELQLRVRFQFTLTTAGGRELAPATELLLARDMNYNETGALGKGQEEAQLYAAMQTDIVQQVARRLAQLKIGPAPRS